MNTLDNCFRTLKKLCVWFILMPIMVQAAELPPGGIQFKSKEGGHQYEFLDNWSSKQHGEYMREVSSTRLAGTGSSWTELVNKITIDLTDDLKAAFKLDFPETNPSSLEALDKFSKNPELVDAWKTIKYNGDNELAKLATDLGELDFLSSNFDDVTKFGSYKEWIRIIRGTVKNGEELLYRLSKIDAPKVEVYNGDFYRTVDNGLDPLYTHPIPNKFNHRYSKKGEDALYFSSSKEGNIQELSYWGKEIEGKTTTYLYKDIESDNLLDLTNPQVREKLGISLDQITGDSYEFSHILGSWGQGNYSGIIAPSARGASDNKYFVNIVIFKSGTANSLIKGKELIKIVN